MIFLLGGCGIFSSDKEPVVITQVEKVKVFHPNPPRQAVIRDIQWQVLNAKDIEKLSKEVEGKDVSFFVLTDDGYESLALNMQELIRYISELQEHIRYYRRITNE